MTVLGSNVMPVRLSLKRSSSSTRANGNNDHNGSGVDARSRSEGAPTKRLMLTDMINGYRAAEHHSRDRGGADAQVQEPPVATLSNMGNTCFLNSVLYTLRFAPTFLHNLHHLTCELNYIGGRVGQNKAKTSSLGRNVSAISGPSSRSTSSKDLLSLGASTNDVFPKPKVQIVTEKLHDLFMSMHNLEIKDSTESYQPNALLQAVREANYIFEGNHQQDAHELLVYLLDNIRDTCDVLAQQVTQNPDWMTEPSSEMTPGSHGGGGGNNIFWGVRRSWKKTHNKKKEAIKSSSSVATSATAAIISEEQQVVNGNVTASGTATVENDTMDGGSSAMVMDGGEAAREAAVRTKKLVANFVAEDFEGVTLRRTKCLECESVTERKEPFYDIPVPIPVSESELDTEVVRPSEIYRKACVTSEKLCDSNKYLCENCKRYNEASRDVLFEKLPNIMVLQLKRFTTSSGGVQKVNTFMPTPLELECFCETCCKSIEEMKPPPHRYRLCCVIMHLGGTMASGHYIAYVKASNHHEDYAECSRGPKGSLSASSSEKSLNILKYLKSRTVGAVDSGKVMSKNVTNGVRSCKMTDCCGVKLNKNIMENLMNSYSRRTVDYWNHGGHAQCAAAEDMWLECDDENVRPITSLALEEELSYKPNSTSTPYLLFYSKIKDLPLD